MNKRRELVFPIVVFLVYTIIFSMAGIVRIDTYVVAGYDLGIFDQVVRAYARFQAPLVTLKGDDYNIWGDHFHPIVALWAPLYWIWDNIRVLAIGHALVVASAVFPVWSFVRRHFTSQRLAKVFAAVALIGWPIQGLIGFDAHEIAFAVPLIAWIIDALDRRDDRALLVCSALLLLVREDMGILVAVIGLIRLMRPGKPRGWWKGLGLIAAGLGAFAVVTAVIIPSFANEGYQYWDYGQVMSRPWEALWLWAYPWTKMWTWLALLVPVGFLALLSPYLLIAVPVMAERMLASRELLWGVQYHYNSPVWIVVCLASVDGARRLSAWLVARKGSRKARPHRWLTIIITSTTAVCMVLGMVGVPWFWQMYPLQRVLTGAAFQWTIGAPDRREVVEWLPADTCVAADDRVAGQLTHTNRVTVPGVSQVKQDFYVLDFYQPYPATTPAMWTTGLAYETAIEMGFHIVKRSGTILVLQSPDYTGPDPVRCGPGAR